MIPTRDELIARVDLELNGDPSSGEIADFALTEIRRAVIEELEALRKWNFDAPWEAQAQHERIVLAALRAEQNEQPPPGAATAAEPQQSARKLTAGAAGSTPAPGATAKAGASERTRLRDESPAGNVAAPALSDADVLERAAEIVRKNDWHQPSAGWLEQGAKRLRRAPKPVDIFEAFAQHANTSTRDARDWFGPSIEALEWCATFDSKAEHALAALRRRAEEASR